jgi:NTP pyrophosphatase (non-canonical NTP hydrolase)
MGYYQDLSKKLYKEKNYTHDPVTLALGVCEECGELAKAINVFHNRLYKTDKYEQCETVKHEMEDILMYLAALANSLKIEVDF